MGIMSDVKKAQALDNLPDLTRWGVTDFKQHPKGYPVSVDELGEKGFRAKFAGEFEVDNASVWENEDGSWRLSLNLAGHEAGPSKGDRFRFSVYLRPDELAKPDGFLQERSYKTFVALLQYAVTNELLPKDYDAADYDAAVQDLCRAWESAKGHVIKAGFSVYVGEKDGSLIGPYLNLNYLNAKAVSTDTASENLPY